MKVARRIALIGDTIDNQYNVDAMMHAAEMFDTTCAFKNPLAGTPAITCAQISDFYSPVLALENWKHAQSLYGYRLSAETQAAVVVGNERRGVSQEMAAVTTQAISI